MLKWPQKSKLRPTRQIIRLSVIRSTRWVKTVSFSHHKSPSQRINTWQPTGREGTMPSWTKPTPDRLIIRLNDSKSINYATPTWNKHIYLTRNSVETNTHVSTLHSMIPKQLSKIGQSTKWHFDTQSPVGVQISLRYSTLKCTRLTSPQYPVAHPGHQQLSCWTWHGWPESSHMNGCNCIFLKTPIMESQNCFHHGVGWFSQQCTPFILMMVKYADISTTWFHEHNKMHFNYGDLPLK